MFPFLSIFSLLFHISFFIFSFHLFLISFSSLSYLIISPSILSSFMFLIFCDHLVLSYFPFHISFSTLPLSLILMSGYFSLFFFSLVIIILFFSCPLLFSRIRDVQVKAWHKTSVNGKEQDVWKIWFPLTCHSSLQSLPKSLSRISVSYKRWDFNHL